MVQGWAQEVVRQVVAPRNLRWKGLAGVIENDYHLHIERGLIVRDGARTKQEKEIAMNCRFLMRSIIFAVLVAGSAMTISPAAFAEDPVATSVVIKNHRFEPAELRVPAGRTVRLTVQNADATPEEFESHDLSLEKIITGGGTIVLEFGPLKAGTYQFVGEFNEDSAQGRIVAE